MSYLSASIGDISVLTTYPHQYAVENGELIPRGFGFCQKTKETPRELQEKARFLTEKVKVLNNANSDDLRDEASTIKRLFFKALPTYPYDRREITRLGNLEEVLDSEVALSHHAPDRIDPVTNRRIQETISEALFSLRLGVKPGATDSEYHEVYCLLDRSQEPLGIFKPLIRKFFLNDRYGSSEDREGHLAEVANSKLDEFLGTRLVPHTELLTCDLPLDKPTRKTGSFQFYVKNASPLYDQLSGDNLFDPDHEALAARLDVPANQDLQFPNFEAFALFDLLTGNNDHHFRNILLKKVAEKTWDLTAIDNANSFPWCHHRDLPRYKMKPNHWFKWSTLPQAQKPFSDQTIDQINALVIERVEELLRAELVSKDVPSSKKHIEAKIGTMRDRYEKIKELANQGATLSSIAKAVLSLSYKGSLRPSLNLNF